MRQLAAALNMALIPTDAQTFMTSRMVMVAVGKRASPGFCATHESVPMPLKSFCHWFFVSLMRRYPGGLKNWIASVGRLAVNSIQSLLGLKK